MGTVLSNKPALLAAQMRQMLHGLEEYSGSYTPTSPSKDELQASLTNLEEKLQAQINAAGKAEAATQGLQNARQEANYITRRMRDAIYAHFGKRDARIVAFGLDTLKSKSPNGTEKETGTEEATTL